MNRSPVKAEATQLIVAGLREAYRRRQVRIDQALERSEAIVSKLERDGETMPAPERVRLLGEANQAQLRLHDAKDSLRELVALREFVNGMIVTEDPAGSASILQA